MSKVPSLSYDKIIRALQRDGWVIVRTEFRSSGTPAWDVKGNFFTVTQIMLDLQRKSCYFPSYRILHTQEVAMITTTLSGKGQIVIPKSLRESRRWRPGTRFIVEEITSGILLKPNRTFPLTRPEDGLGCTGYQGPVINLQDMEQAIQGEIRKRWRKGKTT